MGGKVNKIASPAPSGTLAPGPRASRDDSKEQTEMAEKVNAAANNKAANADDADNVDNRDNAQTAKKANKARPPPSEPLDLYQVRRYLTGLIPYAEDHDDGSYAPLFIRLAWHLSGTYDQAKGNGGSNGCTLRLSAEANDPENKGLQKAFKLLAPCKAKFPFLSWADLVCLAGTVAIEISGGPAIPFATGRKDYSVKEAETVYGSKFKCPFGDGKHNPHKSRLPPADLPPLTGVGEGASDAEREAPLIAAIRGTFRRMGMSDKECVCLILLGHQYGRCHADISGYEEAWYAFGPAHWSAYEGGLGYLSTYQFGGHQEVETRAGKRQFNLRLGGRVFMMLPADKALWWDEEFRKHVMHYDRDRKAFKTDAAAAWKKLIELGCDGLLTPEAQRKGSNTEN